jgi:hypothetical protein
MELTAGFGGVESPDASASAGGLRAHQRRLFFNQAGLTSPDRTSIDATSAADGRRTVERSVSSAAPDFYFVASMALSAVLIATL